MTLTKISTIALLMGCAFFADAKADDMGKYVQCMGDAATKFAQARADCEKAPTDKIAECFGNAVTGLNTDVADCDKLLPPAPTKK